MLRGTLGYIQPLHSGLYLVVSKMVPTKMHDVSPIIINTKSSGRDKTSIMSISAVCTVETSVLNKLTDLLW